MISTRLARAGALAPKSRLFLGTRAFATVGDSPLDKKVEMANTEKGNYINYKYAINALCTQPKTIRSCG
jgi:aconitate hydratase